MNDVEQLLLNSIVSYFKCGNSNVVIIDESTVTINDDMGKPGLKVLVNPTVEATLFMLGKEGYTTMIAGIKLNEEFCFWDREKSSHNNVALQLGYGKNFIGFYIEPHFNGNIVTGAAIKITDFSGSGVYEPDECLYEIQDSKFMKSLVALIDARNGESEIIDESTVTLDNDMGDKTIRVSVDPTTEAVMSMLDKLSPGVKPGDDWGFRKLGGIKSNDEFCFWDRDDSSHNNIAYQLGYKKNFIGFYLIPVFDETNDAYPLIGTNVLVTKFSGMGKYDFKTATEELSNSIMMGSLISTITKRKNETNTGDNLQMS